eukprot:155993-Rhodomonas_salina.1
MRGTEVGYRLQRKIDSVLAERHYKPQVSAVGPTPSALRPKCYDPTLSAIILRLASYACLAMILCIAPYPG